MPYWRPAGSPGMKALAFAGGRRQEAAVVQLLMGVEVFTGRTGQACKQPRLALESHTRDGGTAL